MKKQENNLSQNIFLVNSFDDLQTANKYITDNKLDNYYFCALSRQALLEFKKNNINCSLIDEHTSNRSLNDLGFNNFKVLELLCSKIDKFLRKEVDDLEKINVYPFSYNFYFLKFLIDTITAKILILENFLNHENIKKNNIFFFDNNDKIEGEPYPFNENLNIFSLILKNLFDEKNIFQISSKKLKFKNKEKLKNNFSIFRFLKNNLKYLINLYPSKKKKFVMFSYGHDLKDLRITLKKNNFKEFFVNKDKMNPSYEIYEKCKIFWNKFNNENDIIKGFDFKNKNYFPIIKEYLKSYIEYEIPKSINNFFYIKKSISKKKISFVLTGSTNLGINLKCMLKAFQSHNIPIITYTEGAGYGSYIRPISEYTEYLYGDIMFCYGKGNLDYFNSSKKKSNKKLISVGSVRQYNIFKKFENLKIPKKINSIMYISNFFKDNWVTIPYGNKTGLKYLENQIKILEYLKNLNSSIKTFVKPHPHDYHFKEVLKFKKYEKIITKFGNMERALNDIDLFIIDYPSTVLLDALNTKAYIFLLQESENFEFSEQQKEQISKRVFIFNSLEDINNAIKNILKDTYNFPPKLDDSFMNNYSFLKKEDPSDTVLKNLNKLS